MARADVLLVSVGGTAGLREADAELAASLRRAGAQVAEATAKRPREWRTFALIEFAFARAARAAAAEAIHEHHPRAVLYSSTTAALLAPHPCAIRFDAPAAGNRPGRHGVWQRPVEKRRFRDARLLVPWSEGGLAEAPEPHGDAVVVPVPVEPSGATDERDITAITYGANPAKKGLDRVLAAWEAARHEGEELTVAGLDEDGWQRAKLGGAGGGSAGKRAPGGSAQSGSASGRPPAGVRFVGMLSRADYRALLRRARVFVCAPRREDYGIAQLEALADGCQLVTTASPGPYAALPLARELDSRLVGGIAEGIRAALDHPAPGYAARAAELLAPWRPEAVDEVVREQLLPRLVSRR
jgi:glycosyltransferase involved in cell wall biosynthesis